MLETTLHDEKIYTFKMPNYSRYSHYKEEGKPLLDNASLAIEFPKQAVNRRISEARWRTDQIQRRNTKLAKRETSDRGRNEKRIR